VKSPLRPEYTLTKGISCPDFTKVLDGNYAENCKASAAANSTSSSSEMEVWKWPLDEHRSECSCEWWIVEAGGNMYQEVERMIDLCEYVK
jgi:hypothetical protein